MGSHRGLAEMGDDAAAQTSPFTNNLTQPRAPSTPSPRPQNNLAGSLQSPFDYLPARSRSSRRRHIAVQEHATPPPRSPSAVSRRSSSASSVTLVSGYPSPSIVSDRRHMASSDGSKAEYGADSSAQYHPSHPYKRSNSDSSNSGQRRPLIDYITNDWKSNPKYADDYGSDSSDTEFVSWPPTKGDFKVPRWMQMIRPRRIPISRRVQRFIFVWVAIALATWLGWIWIVKPAWDERIMLDRSFDGTSTKGSFGSNAPPAFSDMVQVKTLDSDLLPTADDQKQRLVFVGDVHGCKEELVALLDKISFHPATDHLILTGDVIAKGPKSPEVVDLALSLKASCVRGNHEDRVLLAHKDLASHNLDMRGPHENPKISHDALEEESFSKGDYKERKLAKSFSDKQIEWLESCPVILRVGQIEGMGEVLVAHAGLVPAVALERQDPFQVMNMRTIDLETRMPSEEKKGTPWEKLWNHYQSRLRPMDRQTVIYGHKSKRGLNLQEFSKGLDTGCVKGGKLTALVVEAGERSSVPVVQTYMDVQCSEDYTKDARR